jgi:hypothetical protein
LGPSSSAFNSLSRDHGKKLILAKPRIVKTRTFNSLSRDHFSSAGRRPRREHMLSTPSLGITQRKFVSVRRHEIISFNSLSRDHGITLRMRRRNIRSRSRTFQLPLSGSLDPRSRLVADRAPELSTPSLGITEPDSGIFRLSAAFCRGAPSHK